MRVFLLLAMLLLVPLPSAFANDAAGLRHTLQAGETLSLLAARYGVSLEALRQANPGVDMEHFPVGLDLQIPAPASGWPQHTVLAHETLWAVSRQCGVSVDELKAANGLTADGLEVGQILVIPRALSSSPAEVPPAPPASGWVEVRLSNGQRAWAQVESLIIPSSTPQTPDYVLNVARRLQGIPYHWGGTSPEGLDCSGFVCEVFRLAGYELPRLVDEQFSATREVAADSLAPGDLGFFTTYLPGPSHVGIYIGEGQFIHASSSRGVTVSRLDEAYYSQRFLGAHRLTAWFPPVPSATPDPGIPTDPPA